ncbi:Costars family protein [Porphyridium purpureum]|uniref:Costars family protein n=1 Tax=Porphyridium purpureum TaxID=35688 RepID=A0A5J4YWT4_PORPP|nr:Costars family protein [Porphyridium purpureum]|eukprot:POR1339..scf227_4
MVFKVEEEIKHVIHFIKTLGKQNDKGQYELTFGDYFKSDDVQNTLENPFATLKAAKKRKIIDFEGEMLWQGQNDSTVLTLLDPDWDGDKTPIA